MPMRIIDATLAHGLSDGQTCGDVFRFPEDEVDSVCALTHGQHTLDSFHQNAAHDRRWRRSGHDLIEAMVRPGSAPLRAETS